jgi:periplasmic protein TonB
MQTTDSHLGSENQGNARPPRPEAQYHTVILDSPNFLVSLIQQIRERRREPKITVPPEYYQGEADLPITEMRQWYRDLPSQLKLLPDLIRYFVLRGLRRLHLLPKTYEFPEIWQDFQAQPGSWLNSLLVHAVVLALLVLPFIVKQWVTPVKANSKEDVVDISPYLPELAHNAQRQGGGGGGGDRTPTPPSRGAVPKFAKEQLTPPMAKLPNMTPKLPEAPTLLGPPDLKPPPLTAANWGDPKGLLGPLSNGPGAGGGIGTGYGTGIGSGTGPGLGPGSGGGTGGGVYSVGGDVTEPIGIFEPDPPYSEEARKAKYQGTCVLQIIVDQAGAVRDVQVVKHLGLGLDEKAEETVKTWKFKPATRNGTPVAVRVLVEVSFRLF